MPGPKVFVSYSHRDEKALEQLQRFLRPLEREGLLAAWADTRLKGGDDWKREIDEALATATVAVLLISQDFLASDFIIKEELPRILEREAAGRLTILPVFLKPSQVKTLGFPDPRPGGHDKVFLTKFQGFGTPDKPLADCSSREKEKIYLALSERLRALAGLAPSVPSAPAPVMTASAQPPSGPARSYDLTVQLEERGEDLLVTYHLPGREPIASATVPWNEVRQRIDPIHEALNKESNRNLLAHLEGSPDGWGHHLFEILFGGPARWEPVLRTLFGRPAGTVRPSPTFGPVRLRVLTEDAQLSGLPWRLTSWQGQPLDRWLFSTTQDVDPTTDVVTTAPSSVLVVAPPLPDHRGGPHDPDHARSVLDVLKKVWPTGRDAGYVQVVHTRTELEQGLRGLRPHLLYVYGIAKLAGGRPSLSLEGGPLPLSELRRLFEATGHTPAVVYLNTETESGAGSRSTPDQIFGGAVPLLLWRRRPEWSVDSATTAVHWLRRWLGQGEDPVAAFHQVHRDTALPGCEACAVAIQANYRTWRTKRYEARPQHVPVLQLDRDRPKAKVRKHLEELVRSGSRRVMALVAYASPGSSLDLFSKQLRHDLEGSSLARLVDIQWVFDLKAPEGRARFRHDLEEELKLQLKAEPNQPVRHLLHNSGPKAVGPNRKRVLWLDWGTFGDGREHQARLTDDQLAAWLQFSSEFLAGQCPDDLHLVSYAALEVASAEHKRLSATLQELRRQPWCYTATFRLTEVELEEVEEVDLLDFLQEPANSSCDPGIQVEVAQRIIARTKGVFAETAALLQEAESGSWYDLLARLRREQGADR